VIQITVSGRYYLLTKVCKLATEQNKGALLCARANYCWLVTVLAVNTSMANAAPVKGKQANMYTVQDNSNTRWNQQDRFNTSY
jgi:hypothetical protein